ncbi:MAG: hypothetical protein ACLTG0_10445 [Oscillibacter sp.]
MKLPWIMLYFQNYGYVGLYGGLKASDIRRRKKALGQRNHKTYSIAMGCEELAANLFRRATQTEAKARLRFKAQKIFKANREANKTHFEGW